MSPAGVPPALDAGVVGADGAGVGPARADLGESAGGGVALAEVRGLTAVEGAVAAPALDGAVVGHGAAVERAHVHLIEEAFGSGALAAIGFVAVLVLAVAPPAPQPAGRLDATRVVGRRGDLLELSLRGVALAEGELGCGATPAVEEAIHSHGTALHDGHGDLVPQRLAAHLAVTVVVPQIDAGVAVVVQRVGAVLGHAGVDGRFGGLAVHVVLPAVSVVVEGGVGRVVTPHT